MLGHEIVSLHCAGVWDCVLTLCWAMGLCPYTVLGHGIVSKLDRGVRLCPDTGLGCGIVSLHWTALGMDGSCTKALFHSRAAHNDVIRF